MTTMKKLTLDQITFVKRKIQQFITLPTSPPKNSTPNKTQGPKQNRSPKRKSILSNNQIDKNKQLISENSQKQSQFRNNKSKSNLSNKKSQYIRKKTLDKSQYDAQFRKKQAQILKYITQENRNKKSILNEFLNSDKIHLKRREEVQQGYKQEYKQKDQSQLSQLNQLNQSHQHSDSNSKSFSFDNNFSSLKKVYKNIGSLLTLKEVHQNKQQSPSNHNPFIDLLKGVQSVKQAEKKDEMKQTKQLINIDSQSKIVKPSALKGKLYFQQNQNENIKPIQNKVSNNPKNTKQVSSIKRQQKLSLSSSKKLIKGPNPTVFKKSNSQLSLQRRNKSSSFSNIQKKQNLNRPRQTSMTKKNVNFIKNNPNNQSKKSFQPYFDSQNQSVILRQQISNNFIYDLRRVQNTHTHYNSPMKKDYQSNQENFSPSVYCRSFKKSPYEINSQQKFLMNKYCSKQLSPDQRQQLKGKYTLLQKRLDKLLKSVKEQKQSKESRYAVKDNEQSFSDRIQKQKSKIPEQILIYQKLSPLKKLLKVNKNLRLQIDDEG